ncbi:uncharacterized protein LOC128393283 isoform X2 [Panonychus citri]|uniref:uncharacterized protein LOC128393283 isoform X2 n=1 Tax=Panonychus citri TaxID=50023 RepID=UPI002307524A|nr:uncharacterized protein LOC128393283 isoform X2 [Panonychus citri]
MAISCGYLISLIGCTLITLVYSTHHHHGGHSNIFRKQDGWGKYEFAYDIHDPWGNKNFRKEHGHFTKKGGHVEGSYGLHDAKGRLRIVKYTAGKGGFVASIKTNEPGTSDEDSAAAFYNGKDDDHGKWKYDVKTHHEKGKDHWGKHDDHKDDHKHDHKSHKHHFDHYAAAASELEPQASKEYKLIPVSSDSDGYRRVASHLPRANFNFL